MNNRAYSTHKLFVPGRHNGQTSRQTNQRVCFPFVSQMEFDTYRPWIEALSKSLVHGHQRSSTMATFYFYLAYLSPVV